MAPGLGQAPLEPPQLPGQFSVPVSVYLFATRTEGLRRGSGQGQAHSEEGMKNV